VEPSYSPRHPVLSCLDVLGQSLRGVADVDPVFMHTQDKQAALAAITQVQARLESLMARVISAAGDVVDQTADRDVAEWLGRTTRVDRVAARRRERLARALDARWLRLAAALAEAEVNVDQAHVIAASLDDLAEGLAADTTTTPRASLDLLERAEVHLLEQSGHFGPRDLKILGAKILDVVAPELAEELERKRLEQQERRARRVTALTIQDLGDGTSVIRAKVPSAAASRLVTCLESFTNPRVDGDAPHRDLGPVGQEKVPYGTRLGHAFCALLEVLDPARLPLHGGDATTVMITIDLQGLVSGLGVGATSDGKRLSAGEVRRLACAATLVPAVLGTDSRVLDLGRSARLFTSSQRKAMALRDRTCRADGCDIPATWTEAHHLTPWSGGGTTDLANGVLLCSHHHHRIHDDRYLHDRLPNGDIRYARRR
jgi:Domain of unknown function (DUF222)/HNH endonuclease